VNAKADAKTVVILGTGATIGSGYTKAGRRLPGDRGFFGHTGVQELLRSRTFPALQSVLDSFRLAYRLLRPPPLGLEEVWTFIEFANMGIFRDIFRNTIDLLKKEEEVVRQHIRAPESRSDDEHCQISEARLDQTLPNGPPLDMLLLAGCDIRRILTRIYGELEPPEDGGPYAILIDKLRLTEGSATTFISLNYDTVLEHGLTRAHTPWYYPHVYTNVTRSPEGVCILKPHGSLNWRFRGNIPPREISTDYSLEPVRCRYDFDNKFVEAMIVAPTQVKGVITSPETQADVTNRLFPAIWADSVQALVEASKVIVIGYSFPSTDHHLQTLCHLALRLREFRQYSDVYGCTLVDGQGGEGTVFSGLQRQFPAINSHLSANGFDGFVSAVCL
jgi:hypothetical protein